MKNNLKNHYNYDYKNPYKDKRKKNIVCRFQQEVRKIKFLLPIDLSFSSFDGGGRFKHILLEHY